MDLLSDIKEIIKNDKEHRVDVTIDALEINIILYQDPHCTYNDDCYYIPIKYDKVEDCVFIPDFKYRQNKPHDYGISVNQMKLITSIMDYLEKKQRENK